MNNCTLSISDVIQIISIVCSSLLSIISVIIALAALLQGNKALKESTRPYITISYEVINSSKPSTFFVIKNYGHTAAKIISFEHNLEIVEKDIDFQFSKIVGSYFAPGQKNIYWFDALSVSQNEICFDISYQCGKKIYKEHVPLKIKLGAISLRCNDANTLAYALQEIAERML